MNFIQRTSAAIAAAASGWNSGWKFFEAAEISDARPFWRNEVTDLNKSMTGWDYDTIVSASRKLYANCGIVKAVDDKAIYAVGRAWLPRFIGKDKAWGDKATLWLVEKYYPISDVRGGIYDFRTNLFCDSINVDVSGDYGVLLTGTGDGWPMTQRIPSHRIRSIDAKDGEPLTNGPYRGLVIRYGVIYNNQGRAVAYRIQTDQSYEDVSARNFVHVFDPSWYDQGRGLPAYTHALNELRDLKTTQGYEQMALQILSEIGAIETNELGGADPTDPRTQLRSTTPQAGKNSGVTVQKLLGGRYKFFKSGSGSKLETLKHDRPGASWESFWDRIVKTATVGTSWPYELAWKLNTLGGAALRAAVAKAGRVVEDRQDLLRTPAKIEVQYAIAKAIKLKELPTSDEWFRWDFTMPAFITADAGREAAQDREDYKLRIRSLQSILAPQGITLEQHFRDLAHEEKLRKQIAKDEGVDESALMQPKTKAQNL